MLPQMCTTVAIVTEEYKSNTVYIIEYYKVKCTLLLGLCLPSKKENRTGKI